MRECLKTCKRLGVSCPVQECRHWIDFEQDRNCTLEAVEKNGNMTLRDVGERLGISFVRVKQIEDSVLKKIGRFFTDGSI
tara:strand:- start:2769 stop:3008 length:240 start_codon:yes stop_codon:yes gene_type:complete